MIEIDELFKKAEKSGSKESIATVYKKNDHTIDIGVRIEEEALAHIFTATSIELGLSSDGSVDLEQLNKTISILWKLKDMGYTLCYDGNGSVYAERITTREDVKKHVEDIQKLLSSDLIFMNSKSNIENNDKINVKIGDKYE